MELSGNSLKTLRLAVRRHDHDSAQQPTGGEPTAISIGELREVRGTRERRSHRRTNGGERELVSLTPSKSVTSAHPRASRAPSEEAASRTQVGDVVSSTP